MEDVLRLYARPLDPRQPVVCLDERPVVLRVAARPGSPMRPGHPTRTDYEYAPRDGEHLLDRRAQDGAAADARDSSPQEPQLRSGAASNLEGVPEGQAHPPHRRQTEHSFREGVLRHLRRAEGPRAQEALHRSTTCRSTRAGSTPPRWRRASLLASASASAGSRPGDLATRCPRLASSRHVRRLLDSMALPRGRRVARLQVRRARFHAVGALVRYGGGFPGGLNCGHRIVERQCAPKTSTKSAGAGIPRMRT